MVKFKVQPGASIMVDAPAPQFYRHVGEGDEFEGDPEKLAHLIAAGAIKAVGDIAAPTAEIPAPEPTVEVMTKTATQPRAKVGRRQ